MDLDKFIDAIGKHGTECVRMVSVTLSRPILLVRGIPRPKTPAFESLSASLWAVVILSAAAGTALWLQGPGSVTKDSDHAVLGISAAFLSILVCWVAFSAIAGLLCRIVRSHASMQASMAMTLRVIATAFILTNLLTFVSYRIMISAQTDSAWALYIFFASQFLLLLFLFPAEIRDAHSASWAKTIALSVILATAFVGVNILMTVGLELLQIGLDPDFGKILHGRPS